MTDVMEKMVEAGLTAWVAPEDGAHWTHGLANAACNEYSAGMERAIRAALPLLVDELASLAQQAYLGYERDIVSSLLRGDNQGASRSSARAAVAGRLQDSIRSRFSEIMGERK